MKTSPKGLVTVDQGWAWVVLCANFLATCVGSVTYMAGLFTIQFAEEFQLDVSVIALCGALNNGFFCFSGPLASFLFDTIGPKKTITIASTIAAIGYMLSAFVTRFSVLCITFGILGGAGGGTAYVTSAISLGFYFDKYRNLAYGVASSGAGVGIMISSPIITYLMNEYGWRGCCFVLSAYLLNFYVIAMVLFPVQNKSTDDIKYDSEIDKPVASLDNEHSSNDDRNTQNTSLLDTEIYTNEAKQNDNTCDLSKVDNCNWHAVVSNGGDAGSSILSSSDVTSIRQNRIQHKQLDSLLQSNSVLARMSSDLITVSCSSLATDSIILKRKRKNTPISNYDYQNGNQMTKSVSEEIISKRHQMCNTLKNKLHHLFTNSRYVLFCLNFILVACVIAILYVHLPTYALSKGTEGQDIATLVSVIGIANIITRILTGVITTSSKCSAEAYYGISLLCLGCLLMCAPLYGNLYAGQIAIATIAGLCNSSFVLMSPFIVEFAGLEALSLGFGFLVLMAGFGFLAGPPIAGGLYDISGSYATTFYFCGCCLLLSAVFMIPIYIISRRYKKSSTKQQR